MFIKKSITLMSSALLVASMGAHAANIKATFTNNAAMSGTYLTPLWMGFHDGASNVFSQGLMASSALEALAEDGNPALLNASYLTSSLVGNAPVAPQASFETVLTIADDGSESYVNVAAMVLPSSDFFIGNEHGMSLSLKALIDGDASSVTYTFDRVFDAGTEVNDFATSAGNPLVGLSPGQSMPNQGVDENGVVTLASDEDYLQYLNLNGADVSSLYFNNASPLATVRFELADVQEVPVPAALPLLASAFVGLFGFRRRAKV